MKSGILLHLNNKSQVVLAKGLAKALLPSELEKKLQ